MRKPTNNTLIQTECQNSTIVWALDTYVTKTLPTGAWISKMFYTGEPNCNVSPTNNYELCMELRAVYQYLMNDKLCNTKRATLCQLDVE